MENIELVEKQKPKNKKQQTTLLGKWYNHITCK